MIIFTAVLPQFIDRSQGHVTLQIATARGDLHRDRDAVRRRVGDRVRGRHATWLGRSSRRLERMTATGGAMLIALGFGLALTSRRS